MAAARVAFVFSGQGPQWAGWASELAAREPVVRDVLADLDARFRRAVGLVTRRAAIAEPAETSRLQDTNVAQPAIFALQVALAALWESWGIRPDAVLSDTASASWPPFMSAARCRSTKRCEWCGIAVASCSGPPDSGHGGGRYRCCEPATRAAAWRRSHP